MAGNLLEVAEGIQYQSADEELAYTITTTNWASSPTNTSVVAYDEDDNSDVTATVFPVNSPTESSDIITLSVLKALTKGHSYRIEVKFEVGTNIHECFFRVKCVM
jgi:hypothetical protein